MKSISNFLFLNYLEFDSDNSNQTKRVVTKPLGFKTALQTTILLANSRDCRVYIRPEWNEHIFPCLRSRPAPRTETDFYQLEFPLGVR